MVRTQRLAAAAPGDCRRACASARAHSRRPSRGAAKHCEKGTRQRRGAVPEHVSPPQLTTTVHPAPGTVGGGGSVAALVRGWHGGQRARRGAAQLRQQARPARGVHTAERRREPDLKADRGSRPQRLTVTRPAKVGAKCVDEPLRRATPMSRSISARHQMRWSVARRDKSLITNHVTRSESRSQSTW
jgi:hypothetical protein